jgi:hypothetical protein
LTSFPGRQAKFPTQTVALLSTVFFSWTVAQAQIKQKIDSLYKYAEYVVVVKIVTDQHLGVSTGLGTEKCFLTAVPIIWYKMKDSLANSNDTIKMSYDYMFWEKASFKRVGMNKRDFKNTNLTFHKGAEYVFFLKRLNVGDHMANERYYWFHTYYNSPFTKDFIHTKGAYEFKGKIKRMKYFKK